MKHNRFLWVLVAIHLGLAIAHALITPYRQGGHIVFQGGAYAADIGAPDERQHVNYAAHLVQGKGFPVFNPKDPALYESYQSHQPPLYYVLAAGVGKAAGASDFEDRSHGMALRVFNSLIGAAGVVGIYFFVLWGFRNASAALGAAAFAALLPMNVALSGAVSNDPLLFALCSWTLAFAARGIVEGWSAKIALGCGVLMGLAFLTKTTAVALWPAVAFGYYLSLGRTKEVSPSKQGSASAIVGVLLLVLPLVIALPWWLRNQSLYGDPLAMKAFTEAFTGSPQAAVFIQAGGPIDYWITGSQTGTGVAWWTLRSFFGVFGYMDIFLPKPVYVGLLIGLMALLMARFTVARKLVADETRPVRAMGTLFFFLVLALFLRFNAQYFQGQARYLFPALAPIAATIGLAIAGLNKKNPIAGAYGLAAVLLALNLYVLSTLPGEFERRVSDPPVAAAVSQAHAEPS